MPNTRDYHPSTSRTSRNDIYDVEREERLPSLHNVVGHVSSYGTNSSTYDYWGINRSLPVEPPVSRHASYDRHDRSSRVYFESPSGSSYSSATRSSSSRQYSHPTGNALASGSSRSSADYPINDGHGFQTFYAGNRDLIPVSSLDNQPQGIVRSYDIPSNQSNNPKKRYRCPVCGRAFDRPSGLESHSLRHTGNKPYACPAANCDKTFNVRSNMMRHYRKQHGGEEVEADHTSPRQPIYSSASRGSSEQSPHSGTFYSSSRRR